MGVNIGNDVVVDRASFVFQLGQTAPFPNFEPHGITRSTMRALIAFPFTRSVLPREDRAATLSVKSLAKTASPTGVSWGETHRESDGTFSDNDYTPGADMPGPVSIAVAVEKKSESHQPDVVPQTEEAKAEKTVESLTRVVVFGDFRLRNKRVLATGTSGPFLSHNQLAHARGRSHRHPDYRFASSNLTRYASARCPFGTDNIRLFHSCNRFYCGISRLVATSQRREDVNFPDNTYHHCSPCRHWRRVLPVFSEAVRAGS